MLHSRYILFSSILLLFATMMACNEGNTQSQSDEEWEQLFNGQNLDGWDLKITGYELNDNAYNTFRVEDGLLKVRYDEYDEFTGQFGHIFYDKPFSHYRLKVEYRFIGEQAPNGPEWALRNNGIMFHSQSAQTMELDQDFPASIEYQMLGGDGEEERSNGNICTPETHVVVDGELITDHCISSNGPTNHGEDWVTAELEVHGDRLARHIINGETVIEYTSPQLDSGQIISGGYFALQAESHPTDIRSVEILNLKGCMNEDDPNFKDYYVEHDEFACENS